MHWKYKPLIAKGDCTAVLDKLANLRAPVDSFFDNVMVNAEDPVVTPKPLSDFKHVARFVLTSGGYFGIAIMN